MNKLKYKSIFIMILICLFMPFSLVSSAIIIAYQYNGMWSVGPSSGGVFKNLRGVSADITYKNKPTVTNGSMSCIWTMLTNTNSSALAQVGYAVDLSLKNSTYYFMGIINNSGIYREYVITGKPGLNSTHNYKVITSTAKGGGLNANGIIDGINYITTTIDFVPNSTQYQEEIVNSNAHFMGKNASRERISNIRALDNTTWTIPSARWQFSTYGGMYNSHWTKSHYIDLWDNRY
jgi:hypothetical protein